jgi:hypothetical protein
MIALVALALTLVTIIAVAAASAYGVHAGRRMRDDVQNLEDDTQDLQDDVSRRLSKAAHETWVRDTLTPKLDAKYDKVDAERLSKRVDAKYAASAGAALEASVASVNESLATKYDAAAGALLADDVSLLQSRKFDSAAAAALSNDVYARMARPGPSLLVASSASAPFGILLEAQGGGADGKALPGGVAAVSFNGSWAAAPRTGAATGSSGAAAAKSSWHLATDQRSSNDHLSVQQYRADGTLATPARFYDDGAVQVGASWLPSNDGSVHLRAASASKGVILGTPTGAAVDVQGGLGVRGDANVGGALNLQGKLLFRNNVSTGVAPTAANNSDPYYLEKLLAGTDDSQLRLTINDNANESLQIWGDSCGAGSCAGPGKMKHKFQANGDATHEGSLQVGKDARFGGDMVLAGGNNWIFSTPETVAQPSLSIAPSATVNGSVWNWDSQMLLKGDGTVSVKSMNTRGNAAVDGALLVAGPANLAGGSATLGKAGDAGVALIGSTNSTVRVHAPAKDGAISFGFGPAGSGDVLKLGAQGTATLDGRLLTNNVDLLAGGKLCFASADTSAPTCLDAAKLGALLASAKI